MWTAMRQLGLPDTMLVLPRMPHEMSQWHLLRLVALVKGGLRLLLVVM